MRSSAKTVKSSRHDRVGTASANRPAGRLAGRHYACAAARSGDAQGPLRAYRETDRAPRAGTLAGFRRAGCGLDLHLDRWTVCNRTGVCGVYCKARSGRRSLRLCHYRYGRARHWLFHAAADRAADAGHRGRSRALFAVAATHAAGTEAQYLLARYVFETLGYRRYEWKCNALNAPRGAPPCATASHTKARSAST